MTITVEGEKCDVIRDGENTFVVLAKRGTRVVPKKTMKFIEAIYDGHDRKTQLQRRQRGRFNG